MEHIAEGTRPRHTAELAFLFPEVHSKIAWLATQGLLELESSAAENKANETIISQIAMWTSENSA